MQTSDYGIAKYSRNAEQICELRQCEINMAAREVKKAHKL